MSKKSEAESNFVLTEVGNSIPGGTIFSIYAINLKGLFRITTSEQRRLKEERKYLRWAIDKIENEDIPVSENRNAELENEILKLENELHKLRASLEKKKLSKNNEQKNDKSSSEIAQIETVLSELKTKEKLLEDNLAQIDSLKRNLKTDTEALRFLDDDLNTANSANKELQRSADEFLASNGFADFSVEPEFGKTSLEEYFNLEINGLEHKVKFEPADAEEDELIENGHQFGIFRGNLKQNWLNSTTQKININDGEIIYFVRLSKLGLLQVRKETKISENLINTLKSLLDSQKREKTKKSEATYDILRIATNYAKLLNFEKAKNYNLFFSDREDPLIRGIEIKACSYDDIKQKYFQVERQRYTLLLFNKLESGSKNGKDITPAFLYENAQSAIACLLQGTLLCDDQDNPQVFKIPPSKRENVTDVSTWVNELCLFSPERGLIFYNEVPVYEAGGKPVSYESYWRSIVRGVECTVGLRAALQLLESRTTDLLQETPNILKRFNENEEILRAAITKTKAEAALEIFARDLANILKVLPPLRSICVPTNAFRSGHSVEKFSYLSENCFNFSKILINMQQNIDELTNFLTFFKQIQMQIRVDVKNAQEAKKASWISTLALVFTLTSITYVSSSFINDLTTLKAHWNEPATVNSILTYVVILIAAFFGAGIWFRFSRARNKPS